MSNAAVQTAGTGVADQAAVVVHMEHPPLHEPHWLDTALPWVISGAFHLGIGLIVVFVGFLTYQALTPEDQVIIVPQSFEDPAYSETPGGIPNPGLNADPSKKSAQDRLKELAKEEGWAKNDSNKNLSSMLGGAAGDTEALGIFAGTGGSLGGAGGNDSGGGKVAAYGVPGGGGTGPRSTFYGTGGNATRIVYIIDTSGSMLDNLDYIKQELTRSVNRLVPLQFVGVVAFSERGEMITGSSLVRATPDAKKDISAKIAKLIPKGKNNDELDPFVDAFKKAAALKPQLIYFITDGWFDPRLSQTIDILNKDKSISINCLVLLAANPDGSGGGNLVEVNPLYEQNLKDLSARNKGSYRIMREKDLH